MALANKDKSTVKAKELLKDLGKPTLRGVKKCPNCGFYNGIRGLSCKNKACNMVLRGAGRKKGHSADAVKIITGSTVQVYSVRLRDRGPDYRGFVELPLHPLMDLQGQVLQGARCYVDLCQKPTDATAAPTATEILNCNHIRLALESETEAVPLTLKNSVLNGLPVSNEIKQAIWLLATETTGPLVQRVSKNVMVVKCKVQPKNPLGFLHFSFTESQRKNGTTEHKFQCTCRHFRNYRAPPGEELQRRCVHFYACICAFASDDALAKEFEFFINLDAVVSTTTMAVLSEPVQLDQVITEENNPNLLVKIHRKDDMLAQASSALLTLQESAASPAKKQATKRNQLTPSTTPNKAAPAQEGEFTSVTFIKWLSSVTERINQTMHYQFDGRPEPLVFHVPQVFFDLLQQRIASGGRKKRLPNATTAFIRKDALPLGTFSKYMWHLTNVLQVKQIFDTEEVPLQVTRSFVESSNGSFTLNPAPPRLDQDPSMYRKINGQVPIKPFELKTYLKVGHTTPDMTEPTPFIIEWIPDILPITHIGELRIKFEYGHQRNGHAEKRPPGTQTSTGQQTTITIL
ncbi:LOW QUALITY PROTEIN: uncharacterized protein C2orf42-like [Patiria miniata]|uniref:Putative treble-clef zinc-finger domain-containing protein n=1 Tax=Patiria miniata TaxID=46514 RepID=A0A914B4G9_PATMI|nr:LOW QUALITY PROTEIN: uncharacterized protein C2orf42-like [Patiria miniata]